MLSTHLLRVSLTLLFLIPQQKQPSPSGLAFWQCEICTLLSSCCPQSLGHSCEGVHGGLDYFDDFVTFAFAKAGETASVAGSIKFVFKALGWLFAEDGDKAPDFSRSVTALAASKLMFRTCIVELSQVLYVLSPRSVFHNDNPLHVQPAFHAPEVLSCLSFRDLCCNGPCSNRHSVWHCS